MAYERRRADWWVHAGTDEYSELPDDLNYFEDQLASIDNRTTSLELGGAGEGALIDEVLKSTNYEITATDARKRLVATFPILFTVPDPGVLGNGFEVRIVNDSGAGVLVAGAGAEIQLDDGDIATLMEANGKQRIFKVSSSLLNSTDVGWTPAMLGPDLVRWWDAGDFTTVATDVTTGKVIQWEDKGYYGVTATQSTLAARPTLSSGEVRFEIGQSLIMPAASRAYIEHTWFLCLCRINFTTSTGTDGSFFNVNGPGADTQRQPFLGYVKSGSKFTSQWRNSIGTNAITPTVAGDDVWHTVLGRRAPEGVYLSIDGGTEEFLACDPSMPVTGGLPGTIGDYRAKASMGIDSLLIGQGQLTQDNIDNLHGWGAWRRGIQSALPALHPYKDERPPAVATAVEAPDGEADPDLDWDSMTWDQSGRGDALDLTGYELVFEDDFDTLDTITDPTVGAGPWFAGGRPDTSIAHFRTKAQTPPVFSIDDPSVLTIKMFKNPGTSTWFSGHLQTVNAWGEGFAQPYGYWECRMAAEGPVAWPAFWLYSQNRHKSTSATLCELDVVEIYATDPPNHHSTTHRHSANREQPGHLDHNTYHSNINAAVSTFGISDFFDGEFHTYGILVTPEEIVIYLDGLEMSRHPMYTEAHLDKFALISLQMQDDFLADAVDPTHLFVDYVKIYAPEEVVGFGFGEGGFGEGGFGGS